MKVYSTSASLDGSIAAQECQTVPKAGLAGKKNGELLAIAERMGFQVS